MLKRRHIIEWLDRLTVRVETTPYIVGRRRLSYQSLPWLGITEGRRADATTDRVDAIIRNLHEHGIDGRICLDIGCNVGFFSLSLVERGFTAYGVDSHASNLRLAVAAGRRIQDGGTFVPVHVHVTQSSVDDLPDVDVCLCLSVWHHWAREQGVESANQILQRLWAKTSKVLYFETGAAEMPAHYGLPFRGDDPDEVLKHLHATLDSATVERLGHFEAFVPGSARQMNEVTRELFAVHRSYPPVESV